MAGNIKRCISTVRGFSSHSNVCQASSLNNNFKNWQDLRKDKLTASTFGRAVGICYWPHARVELWKEKVGLILPFAGNIATIWNNSKEKIAFEKYKLITGFDVTHPTKLLVRNGSDDFLAASPDGTTDIYNYNVPYCGVVEIKCPYFNGEKKLSYPWKQLPFIYIPQAQGLMELLNRDWMDIYCWTLNGSSLFRLKRDKEYWEILKIALNDFWWKHVQPAKELRIKEPNVDLKLLMPAAKHELYQEIVKRSKLITAKSPPLIRDIGGELQI